MIRLGGALRRGISSSARVLAEGGGAGEGASGELRLTLSVPHSSLVADLEVFRVTLPGSMGVYGVEKGSPPMVSELGPGTVIVEPLEGEAFKYVIPGGFAFTNPDNTLSVSIPEAVSVDDIDQERLRDLQQQATARRDAAAQGSKELAAAQLECDVYKAMSAAVASA